MDTKNTLIAVIVFIVVATAGVLLINKSNEKSVEKTPTSEDANQINESNSSTTKEGDEAQREESTQIGTSVDGEPITAYHFGTGASELLFIGGIHGGYSWNTTLVAYELIDYLKESPDAIPENVTVTIIPAANPDGLKESVGTTSRFEANDARLLTESVRVKGRFNSNNVDLNRNFDCDWKESSLWRSQRVSGGSAPFSEPEAVAIKNYVTGSKPKAVVVWFSAEGVVYPSACGGTPSKESLALAETFANAAGYKVSKEFDAYAINGDMVNWFAKENVPAISVLLTDHTNVEWSKNQAGFNAILETFAN